MINKALLQSISVCTGFLIYRIFRFLFFIIFASFIVIKIFLIFYDNIQEENNGISRIETEIKFGITFDEKSEIYNRIYDYLEIYGLCNYSNAKYNYKKSNKNYYYRTLYEFLDHEYTSSSILNYNLMEYRRHNSIFKHNIADITPDQYSAIREDFFIEFENSIIRKAYLNSYSIQECDFNMQVKR